MIHDDRGNLFSQDSYQCSHEFLFQGFCRPEKFRANQDADVHIALRMVTTGAVGAKNIDSRDLSSVEQYKSFLVISYETRSIGAGFELFSGG